MYVNYIMSRISGYYVDHYHVQDYFRPTIFSQIIQKLECLHLKFHKFMHLLIVVVVVPASTTTVHE